ncbi:MAG: hypothetical protein ACXVA2_23340 [Mucilaginibacter sp.]
MLAEISKSTLDIVVIIGVIAAVIIVPITIWGIFKTSNSKIEEQKLLLSVKPRLWLNGAGYKGYNREFFIDLNNKGEVAHLDDFILLGGDIVLHSKSVPYDLESNEQRNIYGRAPGIKPVQDCQYEIEILYHDRLNNKYHAIVSGKGANVKMVVDELIRKKSLFTKLRSLFS